MEPKLLTRDAFREGVFARENGHCAFCDVPAVDAHHILERRLWPDGGYYLDNGASVCEEHHLACEQTVISVEQVREACGIKRIVVPPHLYADQIYDKWGNAVFEDGRRARGELFFDESVQRVLARGGVLGLFTDRVKYPRTHHLPWSPGMHDDDRRLFSLAAFEGRRVIVTRKMDGENTTLYADGLHARSLDSRGHPSRDWVKAFWGRMGYEIPPGWRLCGENLYAVHSLAYVELPSYFLGFSLWDERGTCLSWDETLEWFELLGVQSVPVLYDGPFDERRIRALWKDSDATRHEGYVVRVADSFTLAQFRTHVGKFVRAGHVQTNKHWMRGQRVVANGLAGASPFLIGA